MGFFLKLVGQFLHSILSLSTTPIHTSFTELSKSKRRTASLSEAGLHSNDVPSQVPAKSAGVLKVVFVVDCEKRQ